MNKNMVLPEKVRLILQKLTNQGHEAYVVGGCVRDSLLGTAPQDWDITTSALPQETTAALDGIRVLETGLKHGTVTALVEDMPVEITTYRTDGTYSDHRHPDTVSFTRSLREDLARRDFTINAMAYHPARGLVDYFGGQADLKEQVLRCVGPPARRFQEDGLRILRALRFSSKLGFALAPATAQAVLLEKGLLHHIAAERLQNELIGLLCGKDCEAVLRRFAPIVMEFLPELAPMQGFEQHNPYHAYDVWEHTLHAVGAIEPTPILRLTMLFHDSGKPASYSMDEKGIGHFHGHAEYSERLAEQALRRLKCDRHTLERVLLLIRFHDLPLTPTPEWIKRQMQRFGEEIFSQMLSIHRADILAQNPDLAGRVETIGHCRDIVADIVQEQQCFSLKNLAINGKDLIHLGLPSGPSLGALLGSLLDAVIGGDCANQREDLLELAKKQIRQKTDRHK